MNECDIVKDLIKFGIEKVSKTSRQYIDRHTNRCSECKKIYDESEEEIEQASIKYLKKIRIKYISTIVISTMAISSIAIAIIAYIILKY